MSLPSAAATFVLTGLVSVGLLVAWLVVPQFALPPPTGPHGVGVAGLAVRAADPDRALEVRLWYPAAQGAGAGGPAWPTLDRLRGRIGRPQALPADGRFPVLLYVPGWGGWPGENTALAQELASHGYVVAALGYPVGAGVPDPALPMDFSSAAAYAATLELADRRVRLQAADAARVLDALGGLDRGEGATDAGGRVLAGRLDLGRAAILGYSFGGAVAAQAAATDTRLRAAMNMDGWLFGDDPAPGCGGPGRTVPYLDVNDGGARPGRDDLDAADPVRRYTATLTEEDFGRRETRLARCGGWQVSIAGSHHEQFNDSQLLSPRARWRAAPGIDARRLGGIVRRLALEFFGRVLDGRPSALLEGDGAAAFPELRVRAVAARPGA